VMIIQNIRHQSPWSEAPSLSSSSFVNSPV
jgi:hypothetical protein